MRAPRVTEEAQNQLLRLGCTAAMCMQNFSDYTMIAASDSEKMGELVRKRDHKLDVDATKDMKDNQISKGLKAPPNWKP